MTDKDAHLHPTFFAGLALRQNFGELSIADFIIEAYQWYEEPIQDAETLQDLIKIHMHDEAMTVAVQMYCVALLVGATEPLDKDGDYDPKTKEIE